MTNKYRQLYMLNLLKKPGISKLIEYGTLFGLTILVAYLDTKQNEGSYVKTHGTCQKNIGNSI